MPLKTKTKIQLLILAFFVGMCFLLLPSVKILAATGINKQINFQGKVVNTDGTNVANGSYNFLFCIYTTASPITACTSGANNDAIWRESKSLTVTDGIFQSNLGDTNAFGGSVNFNTDNIYLGINFNSNGQMTPLVQFTASPYALNSDKLQGGDWASPGAIGSTTAAAGTFTSVTTGSIATASGVINLQPAGSATTSSVQIGSGGSGSTTPDFFGLDVKSTTGDPAGGYEGAMYYNTFDNKFRCFQGSGWVDCAGVAGSGDNLGNHALTQNLVTGSNWISGDGNNEGLYVDSNGNVGVGASTFDATYPEKLKVDAGTTSSVNVISGYANINSYAQLNIKNLNAGGSASSDLVATANNGTESNNYVDLGINSSGYNDANYNIGSANDAYLYNMGGDIAVGTGTASKIIKFFTGGTTSTNERLRVNDSGLLLASGGTYSGQGAVSLSSGSGAALTINSGTTGNINIGDDSSSEIINIGTGAGAKSLNIGSLNTTSGLNIQSGTNGINMQVAGTGTTGTVQIGSGSASTTPDLLSLDVKSDSTDPTGTVGDMYYNSSLGKFRCFEGSAWTNCIGSGGTPGGADKQIQFNDGGSTFGTDTDFAWDKTANTLTLGGTDTGISMKAITTEPSATAAGTMRLYAKSIAGRLMPKWIGPSGLDQVAQPLIAQNKVAWWNPAGSSTTAPGILGMPALTVVSNGGSALVSKAVATTNLFTRLKRTGVISTTTAGTLGSLYQTVAQYTIGNGSGLGGFTYVARFGTSDAATVAGAREFVGMSSSVAAPTSVEPSTLTNSIGIGHGASDTNLKLYYGGSAAQTPIDLGANFPANTLSTDMYELILYAPTNSNNTVGYKVTRLNTGNVAEGTFTAATPGTQLPAATTLLAPRFWRTNNATALAVGLDVASLYIETDD